jgi:hypothetical protein
MHHSGLVDWGGAAVQNASASPTAFSFLEVAWSAYARPHLVAVPPLVPGESMPVGSRIVPLVQHDRLAELQERKEVWWEVRHARVPLHRSRVHLLAANEWTWGREYEAALAAFVQPGAHAVTEIVSSATPLLERRTGCSTYQQALEEGAAETRRGRPARAWAGMAASLYDFLHDKCDWRYEYEPPSFEEESQKVLLPDTIWQFRRGTCIDLAVAFASCLERTHLRPVVAILRRGDAQHALAGWWARSGSGFGPVLRDKAAFLELTAEEIQLVECTGFAVGQAGGKPLDKADFSTACRHARQVAEDWDLWALVDVCAARERLGITPLPAAGERTSRWEVALRDFFERQGWALLGTAAGAPGVGWLTERGTAVWIQALRDAVAGGSGELTTRHLLLALLAVEEAVAERVVGHLGADPAWLRGKLIRKVRPERPAGPRPVTPSDAIKETVQRLWKGHREHGGLAGEADIFRAALGDGRSVTVKEFLADLKCDRDHLLPVLEEIAKGPRVQTNPSSGNFPPP